MMVSPFQSHHDFLDDLDEQIIQDLINLKLASKQFWEDHYAFEVQEEK